MIKIIRSKILLWYTILVILTILSTEFSVQAQKTPPEDPPRFGKTFDGSLESPQISLSSDDLPNDHLIPFQLPSGPEPLEEPIDTEPTMLKESATLNSKVEMSAEGAPPPQAIEAKPKVEKESNIGEINPGTQMPPEEPPPFPKK